jgi:hypothetical protein
MIPEFLAPIAAASFFCKGKSPGEKDTAESGMKLLNIIIITMIFFLKAVPFTALLF